MAAGYAKVYEERWFPATVDGETSVLVADIISKLQKHDLQVSCDSNQSPTPSPTQWAAITAAASKALVALHFYQCHTELLGRKL